MLGEVAVRSAVVIPFPLWRVKSRASASVFYPYMESEALERAQARLLWACTAAWLLTVAALQILS
jgi:hypothetical protein